MDTNGNGHPAPLVVKDLSRLGEVHTVILFKEQGVLGCSLQGGAGTPDNEVFFSKIAARHHDAVLVGDRIIGVGADCTAGLTRAAVSAALQAAGDDVAVTVLRLVTGEQQSAGSAPDVIRVSLSPADVRHLCVVEVEELEECRLFVEEDVKGIFTGDRLLAINDHLLLTQDADELYNLLDDLHDAGEENHSIVFTVARLAASERALAFDLPVR